MKTKIKKPHNFTYSFQTGRVYRMDNFLVIREPFEIVATCDDCKFVRKEYCTAGYIFADAIGGVDNSRNKDNG